MTKMMMTRGSALQARVAQTAIELVNLQRHLIKRTRASSSFWRVATARARWYDQAPDRAMSPRETRDARRETFGSRGRGVSSASWFSAERGRVRVQPLLVQPAGVERVMGL
jgi:hypothetical protein